MCYMPKPKSRAAFTLIELLVVVAIIALLVAILVPSLTGARNLARQAVCAVNTHQIAVATLLYADNNYGYVPPNNKMENNNTSYEYSRHPWPYATDARLDAAGQFITGNGHVLLLAYMRGDGDMNAGPGVTPNGSEPATGAWDIFCCPGMADAGDIDTLTRNYWSGTSRYTVSTLYNQFCGYEFRAGDIQWIPSSYRLDGLHPRFPVYGDYTTSWPSSPYVAVGYAHDSGEFGGLNSARADGSVDWISADEDLTQAVIPLPANPAQNRCYWMATSR